MFIFIIWRSINFIFPRNCKIQFEFIDDNLSSVVILSRDMYGVCAVKKFIAYTKNEVIMNQFLTIIMTNFINISQNKFGNYLIQDFLEKWWNKEEGTIF